MSFYPASLYFTGGGGSGSGTFRGLLDASGSTSQVADAKVSDYWSVSKAGTFLGKSLIHGEFVSCISEVNGTPTNFNHFSSSFIEVTDNLYGSSATKALSENQGRVLNNLISSSNNTRITIQHTQSNHNFSINKALAVTSTNSVLALANATTLNSFAGIVSEVIDANTFTYTTAGLHTNIAGLVAGDLYYLSTAGDFTKEISTLSADSLLVPIFKAISSSEALVLCNSALNLSKQANAVVAYLDQGLATTEEVNFLSVNGRTVQNDGSKLDALDQGLATTDAVTFLSVNGTSIPLLATNVSDLQTDTTALQSLVSSLQNEFDGFPTTLQSMSEQEATQLLNIDNAEFSPSQWTRLASLNQDTNTTSAVGFSSVMTTGLVNNVDLPAVAVNINTLNNSVAGVQTDIASINAEISTFPAEVKALTSVELEQLANIGNSTIAPTQWQYLGNFDQAMTSSSSPTFSTVTMTTGRVNGVDIPGLSNKVAGLDAALSMYPLQLTTLLPSEISQLTNIGQSTISSLQWLYLGGMNQPLNSSNSPTFNNLNISGTINGINLTNLNTSVADIISLGLGNLTASEISQLENIGGTQISTGAWENLSHLDQDVSSTGAPTFDKLLVSSPTPNVTVTCASGANSELRLLEADRKMLGGVLRYNGRYNSLEFGTYFSNTYTMAAYLRRGSSSFYARSSAFKPGGGSWSSSSDRRLKYDIKPISNALDKICALKGVDFKWKADNEKSAGFIAQDVEKVFSNWITEDVKTEHDEKANIAAEKVKKLTLPFEFDAYIVESIKELKKEIISIKEFLIMEN